MSELHPTWTRDEGNWTGLLIEFDCLKLCPFSTNIIVFTPYTVYGIPPSQTQDWGWVDLLLIAKLWTHENLSKQLGLSRL